MFNQREKSAVFLSLFLDKLYFYEPSLYDYIKSSVLKKNSDTYFLVKYPKYKLGNWIEQSQLEYWSNMNYLQKLMFYTGLYVPEKIRYWSNYPQMFSFLN